MTEQLNSRGKPRSQFQTVFNDESLTVQSQKRESDISFILDRFKKTGIIEQLNVTAASFRDVSELGDFADVFNLAKEAEEQFMRLPPQVRSIFDHDVANWLDSAHDPEKRQALIDAGFVEPDPEATVIPNGPAGDPVDPPE